MKVKYFQPDIFNIDSFLSTLDSEVKATLVNSKTKWANVYSLFSDSIVWPRGLPLDEIHSNQMVTGKTINRFCPIQQYLVDNDPDVDAVFRLVFKDKSIVFHKDKDDVILTKGTWCPFNSQATIFFRNAFPLLYLPTSVTSRITDIWRSFVAQVVLWEHDYEVAFRKPIARQERNPPGCPGGKMGADLQGHPWPLPRERSSLQGQGHRAAG